MGPFSHGRVKTLKFITLLACSLFTAIFGIYNTIEKQERGSYHILKEYRTRTITECYQKCDDNDNCTVIGFKNDSNEMRYCLLMKERMKNDQEFRDSEHDIISIIKQVGKLVHEKQEASSNCIPVNGGFSNWSNFETCNVSCGGGRQIRRRTCDNPLPQSGGMDCIGPLEESRTCNLDPCPVCDMAQGDGVGVSEYYIGKMSKQDCIGNCTLLKGEDSNINGVTYREWNRKCWCELTMLRIAHSTTYETCFLKVVECEMVQGDGVGVSEDYIGVMSKQDCIDECIRLKKEKSDINGVTYRESNKKCWCELTMKRIAHSTIYEACFING